MSQPSIIITMGDPCGIGPEVCLQLLANPANFQDANPVVFGDASVLRRVAEVCRLPSPSNIVPWQTGMNLKTLHEPTVVDFQLIDGNAISPGSISAIAGEACYQYIIHAIDAALDGRADAITTGPINKEALHAAGHHYPGHTEIFIERCGRDTGCMMLTSEALTCSFVTTHVGYDQVPGLLTTERIVEVIQLTHQAMLKIRKRPIKLLTCGLNPHAGENGLFGNSEEEKIIEPALRIARESGIDIEGPVPPDTAFLPWRRQEFDCVVCMYHDQGHIPLKALAFDLAVNTTLGLPITRTSVDHGTAFDIAWQGKANVSSMIQAVRLARDLASTSLN